MRLTHRASGVFLWAAARPANHLGNEILEARWWHLVVSFVHSRVRVQARVRHDPVDQIIDNGGDTINSTEALIKRRLLCRCDGRLFLPRHGGLSALIDRDPDRGRDAAFEHFDSEVVYLSKAGQQPPPPLIFKRSPVDEAIL